MRKKLFVMAALTLGMAMSVTLTSCGDDDEPTPQQQQEQGNGDNNGGQTGEAKTPEGLEAVDLGLPSGTLWANMNVGATKAEEYGLYFAWGETVPYGGEDQTNATNYAYAGTYTKTYYSWSTYKYCNGDYNTLTKYCNNSSYGYNGFTDNLTELTTDDDAATANWGSGWRMPTDAQLTELRTNCTWTWTQLNGVNGYRVTGSNSNSIFLPAAGCRYNSSLHDAGSRGYYWLRTLHTSEPGRAYGVYFNSSNVNRSGFSRFDGQAVRPVRASQ